MLKRSRRGWLMEAVEVSESATSRRAAACGYFPRCGGCALQHLDYPSQLELKHRVCSTNSESVGCSPERISDPVSGPRLHYRAKARLGVRVVDGEVLVGYRESYSGRVVRMTDCPTLIPAFSRLIEPVQELIANLSRPDAIPQVEFAAGDRDRAMILRHLSPLNAADRRHLQIFADHHQLRCELQSAGYDSIEAISPGESLLGYANPDYGLYFEFPPWAFTQINRALNRVLVRTALLSLAPERNARVLDLFCGIGNFSLPLVRRGVTVRGYESSAQAVEYATHNARINGLESRCEFVETDLYHRAGRELDEAEYLLMDPPRSGAGPNLCRWLNNDRIRRAVYISCDPKSFAADARVFVSSGFVLEQAGVFDMFPHTAHVETLGIFRRTW